MKNNKAHFSFLIFLSVSFLCCESQNNHQNEAEQLVQEDTASNSSLEDEMLAEYLFLLDGDCKSQAKSFAKKQNSKLIFFDSKGMFDEQTYKQSPSARLKKLLLDDTSFQNLAKNKFDVIAVSLDCPIGQTLSEKHGVQMYPSIILLDNKGKEIYRKISLFSIDILKKDITENLDKI